MAPEVAEARGAGCGSATTGGIEALRPGGCG
eukprot:CAMPEP_0179320762 /NCGR_PEP_ID=MMETSP0797-20121207/58235_1 /TAXON_ID=47934 /ORGANISM="Dinophysis acuminata, Strain DAEP01" /LENGTH=30 /DNA_ID= /DNA_START= /DNA_END= /DNA_ORIENTATION=